MNTEPVKQGLPCFYRAVFSTLPSPMTEARSRTGDRSSFALVLYSKRLDVLAQNAITQAVRMDLKEAPQREIEKQKDEAEAARLVLEKGRSANKPTFRP